MGSLIFNQKVNSRNDIQSDKSVYQTEYTVRDVRLVSNYVRGKGHRLPNFGWFERIEDQRE